MKLQLKLCIFLLFAVPDQGRAEPTNSVDPSTETLLRGSAAPQPDDLDSSRFTVQGAADPTTAPAAIATRKRPTKVQAAATPSAPAAAPEATGPLPTTPTQKPAPLPTPQPPPKPSIGEQVKVLFLGNDEDIEDFRKQLHPNDRRNNRVELDLAPAYFYDNSTSNYSFRRYSTQGPALDFSTNIWMTPFFGLHLGYFTSLDSSLASQGQTIPADVQTTEFGVRWRKNFGLGRKAASLNWGVDYSLDSTNVPAAALDRVSTSTSGLAVSMQADVPSSLSYSHTLGFELKPRMIHSESSNAGIHSGGSVDTNSVGAWYGGNLIFDGRDQVFWKVRETVEQNQFDGPASTPDPMTGTTPSGVSVTHSRTIFSIGYRWGS